MIERTRVNQLVTPWNLDFVGGVASTLCSPKLVAPKQVASPKFAATKCLLRIMWDTAAIGGKLKVFSDLSLRFHWKEFVYELLVRYGEAKWSWNRCEFCSNLSLKDLEVDTIIYKRCLDDLKMDINRLNFKEDLADNRWVILRNLCSCISPFNLIVRIAGMNNSQ